MCIFYMLILQAFDLILAPKQNDHDYMAEAKKIWFNDRDPGKAIKVLPGWHRSIESNLLHGLSRHYTQRDFLSAF